MNTCNSILSKVCLAFTDISQAIMSKINKVVSHQDTSVASHVKNKDFGVSEELSDGTFSENREEESDNKNKKFTIEELEIDVDEHSFPKLSILLEIMSPRPNFCHCLKK